MGLLKATVYVAHMFLHVCVCVCQSGERVGRRYPWSLPQCCSLRPPQVGRGTSTHQKLEVRSPQDACSFTKYSRYIEFWDISFTPVNPHTHTFLSQTTALSLTKTGRGRPRQVSSLTDFRQPAEGREGPDYCWNGRLWQLPAELRRGPRCRAGPNLHIHVGGLIVLLWMVLSVWTCLWPSF